MFQSYLLETKLTQRTEKSKLDKSPSIEKPTFNTMIFPQSLTTSMRNHSSGFLEDWLSN
jgi:hypothetical protein